MTSTCKFEFDHPDLIYCSGESIEGRIVLQTTKEKQVKGIYIQFEGVGKVRWNERKTHRKDGRTHTYIECFCADEKYFTSKTYVLGECTLPTGIHNYTFDIPLPLECPTTCSEIYGSISYELKLVLERADHYDNIFMQPLTVFRQLDLNLNPEHLLPVKDERIKYFCCWPCSSGPIISTLTIPQAGYVPGQDLKYRLEVDNQSYGYDLNGIKLKLIQILTFTAHHPHRKTRQHLNTLTRLHQHERCWRLSKHLFEGTLRIPAVLPSNETGGIIQVTYHLEMSIRTGDCHTNSTLSLPITIGTIPLCRNDTTINALVNETATDLPPSYDNCKPPSFEEATSDVNTNINHQIKWVFKQPMIVSSDQTAPIQLGTSCNTQDSIQNRAVDTLQVNNSYTATTLSNAASDV